MPPDDDREIFIRKIDSVEIQQTPANEIWYDINPEDVNGWEWTPYTPEAWAESTNPDKVWLDELPEFLKQQAD